MTLNLEEKMKCGVLKESINENMVALIPDSIPLLKKAGLQVYIEKGAGEKSFFKDEIYIKNGGEITNRE